MRLAESLIIQGHVHSSKAYAVSKVPIPCNRGMRRISWHRNKSTASSWRGGSQVEWTWQNINYVKQVVRSWSHSCTIQHRFLILKKIIIFPLPYFPTSLPSRTAQVLRLTDSLASHSLARWVSAADVPQLGVRWFHQGILSLAMCALQGLHCDSRLRTDAESIFWALQPLKIGNLWG